MVDIPGILNYGGFGLAVIVLAVVSRFVCVYFNNAAKRLDEATIREREITDRAMERAGKAEGAWRETVESNIKMNQRVVSTLDALCVEIRNGAKQERESHQDMQLQLSKLEK